jgi:hypothetical protein
LPRKTNSRTETELPNRIAKPNCHAKRIAELPNWIAELNLFC